MEAIISQMRTIQLAGWAMGLVIKSVRNVVIQLLTLLSLMKVNAELRFEIPPDPIPNSARYSQDM